MTTEKLAERSSSMSEESVRDLFDRWERVWHEGQFNLVAECVANVYIRHDESGTRRVTPEEYASEIATAQRERPNTRFIVNDHELTKDRAWFRFTLKWTDASTGEARTRAGMQLYRIERGKLAETWLTLLKVGSAWPDAVGQEHWTSKRALTSQ
jgi:hypothetical protein